MADGTIFECPATPERIDQCPATPDRLLSVKSPESTASISSEANLCVVRQTKSPPPNCAICLGKCKDKCFTDTCQHLFCFKCLQEWSKVKAECPLCKKTFKIIIHNARGEDHYEEYMVPPPIISITEPIPTLPPSETYYPSYRSSAARRAFATYPHRFDVFLSDLPRFSDNEIFRNGFSATVQVHPSDNDALQSLFLQRAAIMSRIRQHPFSNEVVHSGNTGQIWRRFIYEKKLYALPVVDITGRFRECTARFYRENPAQTHRLMPWLNRDLVCLLRDTEHHVSYVLNILSDLLTVYNITSPEFRRRCQPYFGRRTSHFIHEFVNFARSPYDMIGYDREVRYAPYYEEVILSSSDLDESSEAEERRRRRRQRRTEFTFTNRSDFSRFFLTGTFGGFSALSDFDITSESGPINLTLESNDGTLNAYNHPQVLGQNSVIQIDRDIVLSSTSSDECEFVMEQKPPHLRTPEMVTLNSDSDSDVVFISESITKSLSAVSTNKDISKSRKRKVSIMQQRTNEVESSIPSSDSDADFCEGSTKVQKKEENVNSDRSAHAVVKNDFVSVKRKALGIKQKRNGTVSSLSSSESIENYCDVMYDKKTEKKGEKSEDESKVETNAGASTSSGIGSVESRTTSVKKYYACPIRRACKSRKNSKSIFEDSSSDAESNSSYSSFESSSSDSDLSWTDSKSSHKRRRRSKHSKRRKSDSKSKKRKTKKSRKKSRKSKRVRKQRNKKYVFSSSSDSCHSPTSSRRNLDHSENSP